MKMVIFVATGFFASPLIAEPLRRCKRARKGDGRARAPPAGAGSTATPWRPPMPTHTTLPYGQPCPCRVPPTTSAGSTAPPTDTWACRACATEWTITVDVPGAP